jgi:DNA-binding NarL/FixJ family response regulator
MKTRIVVADDNPKILNELVSLLQTEFEVVATAADGASARECIHQYRPDVAVLDLVMPEPNGIELAKELAHNSHRLAVIICSVERDPEIINAARSAGVLGYVFKVRMTRDLIRAVKAVAAGQPFMSPE